jgi:uncharacterized protein YodC (DUF2158 family)
MTKIHPGFLPIGTKVRLASGGPAMIVVDFGFDEGDLVCAWKRNGKIAEAKFRVVMLDIVREPITCADRL